MKEYKIWRFAYTCHEEILKVPENTEFYCLNKSREDNQSYKTEYGYNVWNEHWYAVIPYSKTIYKELNTKNALALYLYNINDKYLILDLEQIFPLSDDWKETTEQPQIQDEYLILRTSKITFSNAYWINEKARIDSLNISDKEREIEYKNTFIPIISYIKINGIKYGSFDVSLIDVRNEIDGKSVYNIHRINMSFDKLLDSYRYKIEKSNKDEFNEAFILMLNKINTI